MFKYRLLLLKSNMDEEIPDHLHVCYCGTIIEELLFFSMFASSNYQLRHKYNVSNFH